MSTNVLHCNGIINITDQSDSPTDFVSTFILLLVTTADTKAQLGKAAWIAVGGWFVAGVSLYSLNYFKPYV